MTCEAFSLPWWMIGISSIIGWELGGLVFCRFRKKATQVADPQ